MSTNHTENSLLTSIQAGYRAGRQLRTIHYTTQDTQDYIADKCRQMNVRYSDTIRDNAFEAALQFVGKAYQPVHQEQFGRKFKQYFEEQLLIYCYRKQSPSEQTSTRNSLKQLLGISEEIIERTLKRQFSSLPDEDIRDVVRNAIKVAVLRLNDDSFKLTSSFNTFLLETARNMTHQLVEQKKPVQPATRQATIAIEYKTELRYQHITTIAHQFIEEKSSSTCQAFLKVYWQMKSPFDFIDPDTGQTIRENLVQQRLELTDQQMGRLKQHTLKLTQQQALQLVSGQKRLKQKANDYYQKCLSGLFDHVGQQNNIPLLTQDPATLTREQEKDVAGFKKLLLKWIRTARKNPTTTY